MKKISKDNFSLVIWFSIFIISIVVNNKLGILQFIIAFLIPLFIKKNDQLIKVIIIILIATVMNGTFIDKIFSQKGITVLDILVLVTFFKILIKRLINKNKKIITMNLTDKLVIVFLVLNLISFIYGISKNGNYAIEFKHVLISVLLYFILKLSDLKLSMKQLANIIFNSVAIYTILIVFILILKDPLSINLIDYEGRVAINITLYIFSIPYGIYRLLKDKFKLINISYIIVSLILMIYLIYLNQNRTVIILTSLSVIILFIITFFNTKRNGYLNASINVFMVVFAILIILFVMNFMRDTIQPIMNRFMDVINKSGTYANYTVRINTINYYTSIIFTSILGQGWGSPMQLFNSTGSIVITNGSMDNFFITLGYKSGVISLLVFVLIVMINYINIIKSTMLNKGICKVFLVTVPSLIIGTAFMTAQIHHTMTTAATMWIIFYYFSDKNNFKVDIDNEI